MKAILAFVRRFTEVEHAAIVASLIEPTAARALEKIHALDALFDGMSSDLQRDEDLDADEVESNRSQLEWKQARRVFQIKELVVGKRRLFRAYVGSNDKPISDEDGYFSSLFIRGGAHPKVIAVFNVCVSCDATGRIGAKACRDCEGAGWSWAGGERLDPSSLGEAAAVLKIEAPTDPRFVRDYEAG